MEHAPFKYDRSRPVSRRGFLRAGLGASILLLGCATGAHAGDPVAGDSGDALDLDKMTLTFEENFDALNVSPWGPGTRWIAHTPWNGDFGGARFTNPDGEFPFTTDNGVLRIQASRDAQGKWRSGLLASVDSKGDGFSQQYGYFEMSARLPDGPGVWPAFWLVGKDRSKATAEIDVMEYYGDKPGAYSATVHVWHRNGKHDSAYSRINVFSAASPSDVHIYGVKVDPEFIRMYFDRKLVWKTRTLPEQRQPLFMLLNLGIVDGVTKMVAPDPSFMFVDHVRAYQFK